VNYVSVKWQSVMQAFDCSIFSTCM
jgi:hypothetical protein